MRVHGFRIGRDDGNKSEGKRSMKELRHAEYTESERFPVEIGREFAQEIYVDRTVIFEVQRASDGLRQWSAKL